jgi:hypothetical protein
MENAFLIRILIAIGVIWLVQTLLASFQLKEPANKIIFTVTVIVMVLFAIGVQTIL